MTGLVCPNCDSSFDSDNRLIRAEVTECKLCQKKFVVTKKSLDAYKDRKKAEQKAEAEAEQEAEQAAQISLANESSTESIKKLNCPQCSMELQGQISTGQIVECPQCHKQFEATPERLGNVYQVLSKVTPITQDAKQKPKSRAWSLLMIALGLIFILPFMLPDSGNTNKKAEGEDAPAPAPPIKDPNAPESFLSSWDGSNRELVNLVKSAMNDPKSFEHVETRFNDKGDSLKLYMTYRGKNAFNATVTNKVSADLDKSTRTLSNIQ